MFTVANGVSHELSLCERARRRFDGLDDYFPLCGAFTKVADISVLPVLRFRRLALEHFQLVVRLLVDDIFRKANDERFRSIE